MAVLIRRRPAHRRHSTLREALSALADHVRPHRLKIVSAAAMLILSGLVSLAQPLAAKLVLDTLVLGSGVGRAVFALTGLVAAAAVMQAYGNFLLLRAAEAVVLAGRRRLVHHILRLPVPVIRGQEPGDLISRVTADTTLLRQVATQSVVQALTGFVLLVGALTLMAIVDLVLFATSMSVLAAMAAALALIMPRIRRASSRAQQSVGQMGSAMERALSAFTAMKSYGAEAVETDRVNEAATAAYDQGVILARWRSLAGTAAGLAIHIAFLVVLGVGAFRVSTGAISTSTLVAFLLYVMYLTQPMLQLVNAGTYFQTGRAALKRINEVAGLPTESLDHTFSIRPLNGNDSLVVDNVSFTYPGRTVPALQGLSFEVPGTGLTAIVGPSGAGKTTVLNLIERFYEPDSGHIVLDGRDLRSWSLPELRSRIGYVEQEPTLVAGTLRDNLAYGAPDVTEADLRAAMVTTRLESLLERLGNDLGADIRHRGLSLSGGERQRIAIARALLRRPRLLLFDEATSQLDAVNEGALRDMVQEVSKHTAVLMVAHRLSTVQSASRIIVLQDGRVRSTGRHNDLIHSDELYAALALRQSVAFAPAELH